MGFPTHRYRLNNGQVESKIFDSDAIPEGWVDTPAKLTKAEPKAEPKHKPKGNAK